jgi:EAL domain-containing protein (putative c-di-GMP-specific phosphodiesterase class I)
MNTLNALPALIQPRPAGGTVGPAAKPVNILGRDALLGEIQRHRQAGLADGEVFLVVINVADTKEYDEIIRIFGYEFADDILVLRAEDLKSILPGIPIFNVGFWSVGFNIDPTRTENHWRFLDQLVDQLQRDVICRGVPIPIKAGVGICDLKKGLGSAEDLLQSTFLAGQVSGRSAKGWTECSYELEDDHRRAFSIIADVQASLNSGTDFKLSYQPRIDLRSGQCIGAEALLRWRHPVLGQVAPNEFIPLVEMTGLIRHLTSWVLTDAIRQTLRWHDMGFMLKTSVNISMKNLEEADFVEQVGGLLAHHRLAPQYIEFEFSESGVMADRDLAISRLGELRDLGLSIATDDFGTGSNSFTGLLSNTANIIKIDQSYIGPSSAGTPNQAMVKSMINMAHELGMVVVAEGVENAESLASLKALSCDYAQGYYICPPVSVQDFETRYVKLG